MKLLEFFLQHHQGQCQEILLFLALALHLVKEKVHFIHLPHCYVKEDETLFNWLQSRFQLETSI